MLKRVISAITGAAIMAPNTPATIAPSSVKRNTPRGDTFIVAPNAKGWTTLCRPRFTIRTAASMIQPSVVPPEPRASNTAKAPPIQAPM